MLRKIGTVLFLLFALSGISQNYNNHWINYNQQYFRIPITEEGIYRLTYAQLLGAGFPVLQIDPRSIQLFNKGEEQPIYIEGENDGLFNSSDFILFYGNKNDGSFDTHIYDQPSSQLNYYYSLFNDTNVYFLTFNSNPPNPDGTSSNLRFRKEAVYSPAGLTPEPFLLQTQIESYYNNYLYGAVDYNRKSASEYTSGEGWGLMFDKGNPQLKTLSSEKPYTENNAQAEFWAVVAGASNASSGPNDHHLQVTVANQMMIDTIFSDYTVCRFYRTFAADKLAPDYTNFLFSIYFNQLQLPSDYCGLAWIKLRYPRLPEFSNQQTAKFELPGSTDSKRFLNILNFANSTDSVLLFDLTNRRLIPVFSNGNERRAVCSTVQQNADFYMLATSKIKSVISFNPVSSSMTAGFAKFFNFNSPDVKNKDYIIITGAKLFSTVVSEYQTYRNATGFKTLTVDVNELYDQFAYGIRRHPSAIRNFLTFAAEKFDTVPRYVFIIGKGLKAHDYRKSSSLSMRTIVPSFGIPPSDNLFTSGIGGDGFTPTIPIGRLSAANDFHVKLYKDKVQTYEHALTTPQEYQKKVLHFGGGKSSGEQNHIRACLDIYKQILQAPFFGGQVFTFLKTSSAPIQISTSDSIRTLINEGVGMLTFFGHASGNGFDLDVETPSDWANYGKYPFVLALSCLSGDMFETVNTNTEDFVLVEDRGAVGYLGSTSLGLLPYLNLYSTELHNNISNTNYGGSIGSHIKNTIHNLNLSHPNNKEIHDVCLEMGLHCDPALPVSSFAKPDYYLTTSNIFTNPTNVSTEFQNFKLKVISVNLGKAVADSFVVEVKRTFPDGNTIEEYFYSGPSTIFKDTIEFTIPVDVTKGVGMNQFQITLDARNRIDEMNENNNSANFSLYIKSSDIIPVLPYQYAIIPNAQATLYACTGDPFSPPQNYVFEIDTNDLFLSSSPEYRRKTINHPGGIVSWTLPFTLQDSMVYFWRVAAEPQIAGNYQWRESSFQYIKDKTGWGQSHYFQFKNDAYNYVKYNRPERNFIFENDLKTILTQNTYNSGDWSNIWYRVNNSQYYVGSWTMDGIVAVVFNPVSGEPWINTTGTDYGSYSGIPPHAGGPAFEFQTTITAGINALENFLVNVVPTGYYVLLYSIRNHNAPNFPQTLYVAIENLGSQYIRNIPANKPFIIFGKKGSTVGSAHESIGANTVEPFQQTDYLQSSWNEGRIVSEIAGPASHWGSFHWSARSIDPVLTDSVSFEVIGIKQNGTADTLIRNLKTLQGDLFNLSDYVDAAVYPKVKLLARMSDDSLRTPAQMTYWRLLYEGIPETAIDPSVSFYFKNPIMDEGERAYFSISTRNISNYNMDSLLVKYWIVDRNRNIRHLATKRLRKHPAGDVLTDSISFSTYGLIGNNTLWVEFNPDNDQLEQHHFNNFASINFTVNSDNQNPLLDVTFDGIHIMDGDIVSAKPQIQITLKDENRFIAPTSLADTSLFKVFIQYPGSMTARRIYFYNRGTEVMKFIPAVLPENRCRIEYNAEFSTDGVYKLIVQAKDKSGNLSGDYDYSINFEVITKSTITHLLNWPNPFSTSTRFVFTITGSELPDFFKIQIMTITGKVVREIDGSELGNLHIGRNITDYAWDGTDQYGDPLANGVYLYRVVTKIKGSNIEHKETSADKYFVKDFGKMLLIR